MIMSNRLSAAILGAALGLGTLLPGAATAAETARAYLAGGCFWCVEADFEKVGGVGDVVSGFSGGDVANPTYQQVVRGGTGHLEAVELPYDPAIVSYAELLHLFFRSIDPLDSGGQFCDRGETYTTAIFVRSDAEREAAEMAKAQAERELGRKIATSVLPFEAFFPADAYHQDYHKSDERLPVTSVGLAVPKSVAYKRYREGCGRDRRVRQIWGDAAPFAKSS